MLTHQTLFIQTRAVYDLQLLPDRLAGRPGRLHGQAGPASHVQPVLHALLVLCGVARCRDVSATPRQPRPRGEVALVPRRGEWEGEKQAARLLLQFNCMLSAWL